MEGGIGRVADEVERLEAKEDAGSALRGRLNERLGRVLTPFLSLDRPYVRILAKPNIN
jgi:hypothetical protein